jgi:uncharacterized protein (TIGR02246 family)
VVHTYFAGDDFALKNKFGIFVATTLLITPPVLLDAPAAAAVKSSHAHGRPAVVRSDTDIRAEDEALIRAQAADYVVQYNKGNAAALASQWAPDGTFTDSAGHQYAGRAAIEKFFASMFRHHGVHRLEIKVESIKFPAHNIAIEVGTSKFANGSGEARYTAIHSKDSGHWQMVSVFEHDVAAANSDSINDLGWMVGSWAADSNSDIKMRCEWTASKKFLKLDFYSVKSAGNLPSETEIIGFNPATGSLCSWHFNSDGGVGFGRWQKSGENWLVNARGTDAAGISAGAQYILHKVNDDSYSWKSTRRYAASKSLPDSAEVLLLRRQQ